METFAFFTYTINMFRKGKYDSIGTFFRDEYKLSNAVGRVMVKRLFHRNPSKLKIPNKLIVIFFRKKKKKTLFYSTGTFNAVLAATIQSEYNCDFTV